LSPGGSGYLTRTQNMKLVCNWLQKLNKYFKYADVTRTHARTRAHTHTYIPCFYTNSAFPNVLLANPFWFRKITTYPYILAHIHLERPNNKYPKLKFCISEVIFRYLRIHTSSKCSNALHNLTLIKLTVDYTAGIGGIHYYIFQW
jgi:hypothetical protein